MQKCDMHIHVKDGINNLEKLKEIINIGINDGINTFLLLEHGERISPKKNGELTNNNIPIFFETVNKLKYENVKIYKGIEVDFSYDMEFRNRVIDMITRNNFDYVIGSVHNMYDIGEDGYYQAVIDLLSHYPINIIGHIKLNDNYLKHIDKFKKIMMLCNEKNVLIEINTSERSIWTYEQFVFMYSLMIEYGVKFTIGSDAHKIDEIAHNYNLIEKLFTKESYFLNEK